MPPAASWLLPPGTAIFSTMMMFFTPASCAVKAATKPAAPDPTTRISVVSVRSGLALSYFVRSSY